MKNDVQELLNQQINREFYSAYLYLDFACFFEKSGLKGFASWFRVQAREELSHGMLFIRYLIISTEPVHLQELQPPVWTLKQEKTCETILQAALQHEQFITRLIEIIYEHANKANDLRTMNFLDWFIAEQAEEEKHASNLMLQFELYGHDPAALYQLDHDLGQREYAPPDLEL